MTIHYTKDGGNTTIDEWEAEAAFRDDLDEVYDMVEVGGASWFPSAVLEEMDPVGFRQAFLDWLDAGGYEEV